MIPADLSGRDFLPLLRESTCELEIGMLVNNAGSGAPGRFLDRDLQDGLAEMDLNLRAPVELTHEFAPAMERRGRGGIIFVSSVAAYGSAPFMASYTAAKTFVRRFSNSLTVELGRSGIDVLVVSPGPTKTEGVRPYLGDAYDKAMDPQDVVERALKDLGHKAETVPGASNRMSTLLIERLLPSSTSAKAAGKVLEKLSS